jgi:hypothetical protein
MWKYQKPELELHLNTLTCVVNRMAIALFAYAELNCNDLTVISLLEPARHKCLQTMAS